MNRFRNGKEDFSFLTYKKTRRGKQMSRNGINNNLKIISELIIKENEVQAQYDEL